MSLFSRLAGGGRRAHEAKQAELGGDLARAVALFEEAGAPEEAARVLLMRGDLETRQEVRLQHYTLAVAVAPEHHAVKKAAQIKRANCVLDGLGPLLASSGARAQILDAAQELALAGEPARAAEAYARIQDDEGQASALEQAGDVDGLERLLVQRQSDRRAARGRETAHGEVEMQVARGLRREALAAALGAVGGVTEDDAMQARVADLRRRRLGGPLVTADFHGHRLTLALGAEFTVGRTQGTVTIASQAVSRAHLKVERIEGAVWVRDVGSRNGTQLRGLNLAGPLRVDRPLALTLGGQVALSLAPSELLPGAVSVEVGGSVYLASIGDLRLPGTRWSLRLAADDWLELTTLAGSPALLADSELVSPSTLLLGDALQAARGGEVVLRFGG